MMWISAARSEQAYDEQSALLHAHLASASFCDHDSLRSWTCGAACDNVLGMTNVRPFGSLSGSGYVGLLEGDCVVSFRGTRNIRGTLDDLKSAAKSDLGRAGIPCSHNGEPCFVGTGFLSHYLSVSTQVKAHLRDLGCKDRPLRITGHSLGAAAAGLAAVELMQLQYSVKSLSSFGQPRIGNAAVVRATDDLLSGSGAVHWRLTHRQDPVVHLPLLLMGFAHLRGELYYQNTTLEGYRVCQDVSIAATAEDPLCAAQWDNTATMLLNCVRRAEFSDKECDHMTYLKGLMPYLMGPSGCDTPSQDMFDNSSATEIVL
jgi:hypothetical protein